MTDAMLSAIGFAEAIRRREMSAEEALDLVLARIAARDGAVNAFCLVDEPRARRRAREIDAELAAGGDPGPLAGAPVAVKDIEDCAGWPTTMGSLFFKDAAPATRDHPHVARLKAAGAVPVGKLNTAEFGFAGNCDNRVFGTTRNPWNLETTPGGSSGGSAAALAAGMIPLVTGSDGGGSIRAPAAFTGVVGLKGSHGRTPTADGQPVNTFYGVLTTTVADTARCLDVMAGPHHRDRMSLPAPDVVYEEEIERLDVAGMSAAWTTGYGFAPVDPDVERVARAAADKLIAAAKLAFVEAALEIPNVFDAVGSVYTVKLERMLRAEGFLPERADALSAEVRRNFEAFRPGGEIEFYFAEKRIAEAVAIAGRFFDEVDVLLSPCTATTAFAAEGPAPTVVDGRDAGRTMDAPLTPLANFSWHPSISVPAGLTPDGMPVGLMITGPRHRDEIVLRLARIFEQIAPWPRFAPGYDDAARPRAAKEEA
ncbi:amidase [Marinicauda salina]|uniref:amidase n=1 Tax=Marinicauda salina TaxID=2135793 RepID=UPI0011B28A42|nr:amidase [Marinicauda salina]